MKTILCVCGPFVALSVSLLSGHAQPASSSSEDEALPDTLPAEIQQFSADKERQARDLAKQLSQEMPSDFWGYFAAAKKGDVSAVSNLWVRLSQRRSPRDGSEDVTPDRSLNTPVWQPLLETELAVEAFSAGDPKYAFVSGRDIVASIPPGSIYFGGTDAGRGLVTALSKSHEKADRFFTLTQNALADATYLNYLRLMYGERIYVPTGEDSQEAFQNYLSDAQRRLTHDRDFPDEPRQIKPGEDIRVTDNRVQVSGQVAVMAINARLARLIFDKNPDREFFVEESFPLDWMYPHLSPHRFVLRVHREPLATLTAEQCRQDREFWSTQLAQVVGDWLKPDTAVSTLCESAHKVYVQHNLQGFTGDRTFVDNKYACKFYSKLRSSSAGLYAWRANQTKDSSEQKRMLQEADFAFRQAVALCPESPEAIFRYVNLLVTAARVDDALLIAKLSAAANPEDKQVRSLITELERMQRQTQKVP